jgi:hypothetical protein
MNTLEFLKSKYQVLGGSIIVCISLFTAGYSVSAHDAKFLERSAFAAHEIINKDTENKVAFHEREIAVLKQAFDDLKETNKEIRDTLKGYNEKHSAPNVTTPFPLQRH